MNEPAYEPHVEEYRSSLGVYVVFFLIGSLLLYIVSPAFLPRMFPSPSPGMREFIETFFFPLRWLYENVEVVHAFYDFLFQIIPF